MLKKYRFRRFLSYFLIIIIPFLVFGVSYLSSINKELRSDTANDARVSLHAVRDNLELVLNNSTQHQNLFASNPRFILSLQKLLRQQNMNYDDGVMLNAINAFLYSTVNSRNYLKSIYIYIDGCTRYLSSSDGLLSTDTHTDESWFAQYTSAPGEQNLWVTKRAYQPSRFWPASEIITVFLRLRTAHGVIAVNIDPARFGSILDSAQTHAEQILYILNEDGTLLFSNTNGEKLLASLRALPAFADSGEEVRPLTLDGQKYLYQSLEFSDYHLTLVSMIHQRAAYSLSNNFFMLFFWIAVACTCAAFVISYLITRHNFQQINSILHAFDTGDAPAPARRRGISPNEYDVILQNIVQMYIHSNQLKLELAERKLQQKNAEMAALQMQINPHFLFNTLQTLDMEAVRGIGPENRISWAIGELSHILQYALGDPQTPVALADELRYLRSYSNIQAYRYDGKYTLHYLVDESLYGVPVFRMLLQPLLENSLYHGAKPKEGHSDVWLQIHREGDSIRFRMIDNGVGISAQRLAEIRGGMDGGRNIGLPNVNQRLVLQYGPASALHIASREGLGTVISFRIPLAENDGPVSSFSAMR